MNAAILKQYARHSVSTGSEKVPPTHADTPIEPTPDAECVPLEAVSPALPKVVIKKRRGTFEQGDMKRKPDDMRKGRMCLPTATRVSRMPPAARRVERPMARYDDLGGMETYMRVRSCARVRCT